MREKRPGGSRRAGVPEAGGRQRSRRRIIPREHGAWAMMLVPFAAGAALGGFRLPGILSLAGALFMFLAQPALSAWLVPGRRARADAREPFPAAAGALFAAALLIFLWLLIIRDLYGLLWLGLAAALLSVAHGRLRSRHPRSQAAELAGVATLSLAGPLAYYAGSGVLNAAAGWLWFLSAGYFAISVFQVRLKVTAAARRAGNWRRRSIHARRTVAYLIILWAALAVLAAAARIPAAALLAYAPASVYVLLGFRTLGRRMSLKREGVSQSLLALAFCLLLIAAYRA